MPVRSTRVRPSAGLAARILAALGAFLLVLSLGIASVMPPFESLAGLVVRITPKFLARIDQAPKSAVLDWAWEHLAVPMLVRPAWMLPMMSGLVLVTLAAQLTWGRKQG